MGSNDLEIITWEVKIILHLNSELLYKYVLPKSFFFFSKTALSDKAGSKQVDDTTAWLPNPHMRCMNMFYPNAWATNLYQKLISSIKAINHALKTHKKSENLWSAGPGPRIPFLCSASIPLAPPREASTWAFFSSSATIWCLLLPCHSRYTNIKRGQMKWKIQ